MAEFNYFIFRVNQDQRPIIIKNIGKKIRKDYLLDDGKYVGNIVLSNTILNISPDGGDMITDFVSNISRCLIISDSVKCFFENEGLNIEKIEYLPFILHDKKGRPLKTQYYIANVLVSIPCFDFKRSKHKQSSSTRKILNAPIIEIIEDQIPENATLFRIAEYPSRIVIRSDFLEQLQKKGFTGISVVKTGEYLT